MQEHQNEGKVPIIQEKFENFSNCTMYNRNLIIIFNVKVLNGTAFSFES